MNLVTSIWIWAGGEGSGCHGPNCGRPSGSGNVSAIPYHDGWITKDGEFHRLHGTHAETAVAIGLASKESGAVREALVAGNIRIVYSGPMSGAGHTAWIEVHKLDDDTRERLADLVERMGFPGKVLVDVNMPKQSAEFNGRQVYAWMKTGHPPSRSKVMQYHTFDAARVRFA